MSLHIINYYRIKIKILTYLIISIRQRFLIIIFVFLSCNECQTKVSLIYYYYYYYLIMIIDNAKPASGAKTSIRS